MKQRTFFIAVVLCILTFPLPAALAQDGAVPQAISNIVIPCPMSLPDGEIDGETIVCGQLDTPEDWDHPDSNAVQIIYAVVKAQNESPFPDPVIYFDGGPGASSLAVIGSLARDFSRLRQTRDVILFDQRGIRFSSELICPSEVTRNLPEPEIPEGVNVEEIANTLANVTLASDPIEVAEAYGVIPNPSTVACAAFFEEQGINLSEYSTHNSVLDAVALMRALNYASYNLYGISYGTTLATEVLRYYDENMGAPLPVVRSLLIDGVIPLTADLTYNNAIVTPNVVIMALDSCEADAACSSSYPDIRQRAINLLAAVEGSPLVIDDATTITIADLRAAMQSAVTSRDSVVYLPRMIHDLEQGVADVYLRLQDGSLPVVASQVVEDIANPFDPIASESTALAEQMRAMADEIETLASQSDRLSAAFASGDTLAMVFVKELVGTSQQLGWNDQIRIGSSLSTVTSLPPARDIFIQLIAQLPESEQNVLLGLIAVMDDEDVVEAHTILQDPMFRLHPQNDIQHLVIHCNDRYSAFDISATVEALRAFAAPQLIDPTRVEYAFTASCDGYGLTYPAMPAPPFVTNRSGIPVLVVNGALDKATSAIWGAAVDEHLQSARMLTFPQSEHGATLDSTCAKDVTNAFVTYPEEELNVECLEAMRPVFVLADQPLPATTE